MPPGQSYPPAYQPYLAAGPSQPPYPPGVPPSKKSNKVIWIVGGVVAVFLATVLVVVIVVMSGDKSSSQNASGQSSKPDITHLTESMLVDESSFPSDGGQWQHEISNFKMVNRQYTPSECGALVGTIDANESGAAMMYGENGLFELQIFLPSEPLSVTSIINNCDKIDDISNPGAIWDVKPIALAGIPNWAGARQVNDSVVILGTYRAVLIRSTCASSRSSDAVKLFNDEVAKLQAA